MENKSCTASSEQVKSSVETLYEVIEKKYVPKKNGLFQDDIELIKLRIELKKAPPGTGYGWKESTLVLPHCPQGNSRTVCLFVKDIKKGKKADDDKVIRMYKEKFSKLNINNVSEIIPLHVLRTQFSTFDTKYKLSRAFDRFLVDERIKQYVPRLLGKWFIEKQKLPVPVCLTKRNTQQRINLALRRVNILWMSRKPTYHVVVGNNNLNLSSTVENVLSVLNQLPSKVPGGWKNVKAIFVYGSVRPALPIYVSSTIPRNIDFGNTFKAESEVEAEELSTLPNAKVKVYANGDVDVIQSDDDDDDNDDKEEEDNDDNDDDEEDDNVVKTEEDNDDNDDN